VKYKHYTAIKTKMTAKKGPVGAESAISMVRVNTVPCRKLLQESHQANNKK